MTNASAAIRAILETDRYWSLYALGDLAPGYIEHSEWRTAEGTPALVLLYRAATPPVLFATGDPTAVARLVEAVDEPVLYLHVRPDTAEALAPLYRDGGLKPMWRMALDAKRFRPEPSSGCVRLASADGDALERLYGDGRDAGESPDFFFPSMLANGVFFGVWEGGELAAAAGTHLAVPQESVGAVGNVYTRRDRRGRGLAGALTSAVVCELLQMGIRTVGLNVAAHNPAAVRVYERLGFFRYCPYIEGPALRRAL
ncbi:MAG TPA: GNAT family N-acetyltransferase [Bryobacteraceae bacterium]